MSKRDISLINWTDVDADFLESNGDWVLPQIMAFLGTKMPICTVMGKISPSATLKGLSSSNLEFENGLPVDVQTLAIILGLLINTPRGSLVKRIGRQNTKAIRYATNVPIVLSAFKQYRNINYSAWNFSDPAIKYFLEPQLLELVPFIGNSPQFRVEELLEYRNASKKLGNSTRQVTSITTIKKTDNPDFDNLPKQLKLMLTQVWVYHPSIAHDYAILDLNNIDGRADPLVIEDVVAAGKDRLEGSLKWGKTLPWDDLL